MSTEVDLNNAMDQNQTGSEAMAGGNKMPTNSNITRADRNFDHILRSKHETKIDSNSNNNDSKQGNSPLKNGDSLNLNSYEHFQDGPSRFKSDCLSQVTHLRQLLLLHLELIQQQQEQIQNKDKELNRLKLEKEQVSTALLYYVKVEYFKSCLNIAYSYFNFIGNADFVLLHSILLLGQRQSPVLNMPLASFDVTWNI